VRVFVDWVAELFGRCPLFSGQEDAEQRCLPTVAAEPAIRRSAPVVAADDLELAV
jgi:LysR family transcriptional regulator for bpeEF and oprC